ncbi:MAG: thioesterase family protein [Chloroflexota bacterium]
MSAPPGPFKFGHRFRIRYADTDAMRVVYYANYVAFFETGRVEYLRASGADYAGIEASGLAAAVLETHVRYLAPARFDDLLTIKVRIAEVGKVRFRFDYEIWRESDDTLIVTGYTSHALVDRDTLRPARVPDYVREAVTRLESRES